MSSAVIVVSLLAFATGTYLIWPSRWNVPAHMQLGFSVAAYLVPVFLVGVTRSFAAPLLALDAKLLGVGAAAYLLGLVIGNRTPSFLEAIFCRSSFVWMPPGAFHRFLYRRTTRLLALTIAGIAISFIVMGFVPALARNPLMAKFFRGSYQAGYKRVEVLYRTSYYAMTALVPVALILWYVSKKLWPLVLVGASALIGILALARGPVAGALVLGAGIVAAHRRTWTALYIGFLCLIYPFGAALYQLLGVLRLDRYSLLHAVAWGAPDVSDQLNFLLRFMGRGSFTYGKTFWGGLIPGHYRWNPAVYSLTLGSASTGVNGIISGGLRLAPSHWGYVAFGWAGAVAVPLLYGILWGGATVFAKKHVRNGDLLRASVALLVYTTVGPAIAQFYLLSIYEVPFVLVALLLSYPLLVSPSDRLSSASIRTYRPPAAMLSKL